MEEPIQVQVLASGYLRDLLERDLVRSPGIRVVSGGATVFLVEAKGAWADSLAERSPAFRRPGRAIVLLTEGSYDDLREGVRFGIDVFFALDDPREQLLEAIKCARRRRPYCSGSVHPALIQAVRVTLDAGMPESSLLCRLTPREREVVTLALRMLPNREIARQLFVSVETVKTLLHRAYRKLGASGRTQLLMLLHPPAAAQPGGGSPLSG
jgi:DNA-binding NarL/FixJ family response regulator